MTARLVQRQPRIPPVVISPSRPRRLAGLTISAAAAVALLAAPAQGASSNACDGGAFRVTAPGAALAQSGTIAAGALTGTVQVRGLYQRFDVDPNTLSVYDFTFTGAANPRDMTGGVPTQAFASKVADLGGATLTGPLTVTLDREAIQLSRGGAQVSMGIQAKDCADGGIFQMEPQRADGGTTRFTHTLGAGAFYFDNPNFRAHAGEVLNGVTVTPRVNFANDRSPNFVGRDSAQMATRLSQFGKVTTWSVQSGGRMGQVMGEDATDVAAPPTACTHQCQAQNRGRGAATNLGFPFPVPAASRLTPDFPA
jgi:hypothetical protein